VVNLRRRHILYFMLAVLPLILLVILALPVSANPGLTVSNAIWIADVSPGQTVTRSMTVSIGNDDPATDIAVQGLGMVEYADGSLGALTPSEDNDIYSARSFITLDKDSFHLEPGGSENVTATIQIPQDVGAGGRYAMINIKTQAVPGGGGVKFATAVNVPVYLTIKDSQLVHTGSIIDISTGNITSGQPVAIFTDFQNTGNHHFKIKGEVTVSDSLGQVLGTVEVPLTAGVVLTGVTRRLDASFIHQGELAAGKYTIDSKVMLEDGTLLDESTGSFEVAQAYTPPPGTVAGLSSTPAASASSASSNQTSGAAAGFNWTTPAVFGAIVVVVALIVTVYFVRKRR
jgi:hypothetical protein